MTSKKSPSIQGVGRDSPYTNVNLDYEADARLFNQYFSSKSLYYQLNTEDI